MLLTSARVVPVMARVCWSPLRPAKRSSPSSWMTSTDGCSLSSSAPLAPLTDSSSPFSLTSTPAGSLTGFLATRDMLNPPLEYGAEDFATDTGGTSSTIRHHTLVGGNDRDAQTTANFRQLIDGLVLAQAGTAGALELFNDRTAFEILELDGQQRLGFAADLETRNVTFVLQNVGDCHLQLGGRHAYDGLFSHLGITDTS